MRAFILVLLAPILGACASMHVTPSLQRTTVWTSPDYCGANWTRSADDGVCRELQLGQTKAAGYLSDARALDREQIGWRLTQIASAVALAGFNAYDAHEDNTTAALLVGGTASTLNAGLHPAASARVHLNAYRASQCVVQAARPFANREALRRSRLQAAYILTDVSANTLNISTLAAGEDPIVAMTAGVNLQRVSARASAVRDRLRLAAGAQSAAAARVKAAFDAIDAYTDSATSEVAWEDIIANLRKPPEPAEPDETDAAAVNELRAAALAPSGGGPLTVQQSGLRVASQLAAASSSANLNQAVLALDLYLDTLAQQEEGPGEDEYAAIGECVPGV